MLPYDLIPIIFNYIGKITDKRQFLRTCKSYNKITKHLFKIAERNFKMDEFHKIKRNCVEKFTLELCYDSYFDMIPRRYFCKNNTILRQVLTLYGKLELLRFAIKRGCALNSSICSFAARYGQLHILKWAIENNCGWNLGISSWAAINGHLHILKWAIRNGCHWSYDISYLALQNGHFDIVKWIIKHKLIR